jgi:hypothetical protein
MRIDSSGHLLVGNTSFSNITGGSGGGVAIQGGGAGTVWASRNDLTGIFNRLSTDGDIVDFRKNGSSVGRIGVSGNGFYFGDEGDTGFVIDSNADAIIPFNPTSRVVRDNAVDLGSSSGRFKDLHLSGVGYVGTIEEANTALSGTTPSIDADTAGSFTLTTSGNTTFTFASVTSGRSVGFVLKLTAGGGHTITWPSSVDWAGGTAPDAPASGETDVLVFYTVDGGTNWYGALSIDAAA